MNSNLIGIGITAGITAIYTISRAWTKASGEDNKPGYKTTEFWTTVFTSILGVLSTIGVLK